MSQEYSSPCVPVDVGSYISYWIIDIINMQKRHRVISTKERSVSGGGTFMQLCVAFPQKRSTLLCLPHQARMVIPRGNSGDSILNGSSGDNVIMGGGSRLVPPGAFIPQ